MKISLIIRTLNEEKNIGACLKGVQLQSLSPNEVIIVDNQSEDDTLKVVNEFEHLLNIRTISNPVRGYSSGLNLGIKHSEMDYVAFLSADCIPHVDWLLELKSCMTEETCQVAQGFELPYPDNEIHYVLNNEKVKPEENTRIIYFNNTNVLYDKKSLTNYLPFSGVDKLQASEDTLLAIKFKEAGYRAYLAPKAIVYHNLFASIDEFRERSYKKGREIYYLFLRHPLIPRLYLNHLYWSLKEVYLFFIKKDLRFLKVAFWRLMATQRGIFSALLKLDSTK